MGDSLVKRVGHSACAGFVGAIAGGLIGAIIPIAFHSSSPEAYSNSLVPYCAMSGAAVGGAAFFLGEFFYYNHSPKKRKD